MEEESHELFNHKQMDEFICDASWAIVFKWLSLHSSMQDVEKEPNRNDWIMCVCTLPRLILQQAYASEWVWPRGRENAFSQLEAAACWGHTYCAAREMGNRAMYCSGTESLCGLHRADSCWSVLHMRPYSLPHASTLFQLEHNGALKKTSQSEWDSCTL